MHVVSYHDGIWLLVSTVVLYHDMHGGCSVQWSVQEKKFRNISLGPAILVMATHGCTELLPHQS